MPLLKREADRHPCELFSQPHDGATWWVLHVRARSEKQVARFLAERNLSFYLPQLEQRTRRGNRTFVSWLPLFPGYVFHRGDKSSAVFRNPNIVRVLPVDDQQRLGDELLQLCRLQESGAALVLHPWLGPGDEVTIEGGVFAGYRGVVRREKGTTLLVISVSVVNKSVAVEIGRDAVRPVAGEVASLARV